MDNLNQIKKGFSMGWGAVMKATMQDLNEVLGKPSPVVLIGCNGISLQNGHFIYNGEIKNWKIIGYKYLGELGGNTIPDGQKFKVRKTNEILEYLKTTYDFKISLCDDELCRDFEETELEPYFD